MGLVYDDGRAVLQEGLFLLAAVDEIRQQEVVVADLDRVLPILTGIQKAPVPAVLLPATASPWDTDPFPVIAAHAGQLLQIQHMPGVMEGLDSGRIFSALLYLPDPALQPGVADVVGFPLAYDRLDRRGG